MSKAYAPLSVRIAGCIFFFASYRAWEGVEGSKRVEIGIHRMAITGLLKGMCACVLVGVWQIDCTDQCAMYPDSKWRT